MPRIVLLVLCGWVIATGLVGVQVLLTARGIDQAHADAFRRGGSVIVIDLPISVLWWAQQLLIFGLVLVGMSWAVAFVGKGFRRASTVLVVTLFSVGFLSLGASRAPVLDEWWQPVTGQDVGSAQGLTDYLAQDQRASGSLVLLAAACGVALWIIAQRRRLGDTVSDARVLSDTTA
jgi:hypothetical protein